MMNSYQQIDLSKVKTYPIKDRTNLVKTENFAKLMPGGGTFNQFIDSLPDILIGTDLRNLINAICQAYRQKKPVIWAFGAHVVKCGLSPIIIELMKEGVITAIAINGAGMIHDFEIALIGETSEDVSPSLLDGSFGMATETGSFINGAIIDGAKQDMGIGQAVGKMIAYKKLKHREYSILSQGFELKIPVTVHVAIGTDIIHQHPNTCGEAIGKSGMIDFRIFANQVANLDGGVYLNIGSAVILPEVFLKALTIARNLGNKVEDFVTANFDMFPQYRPMTNVIKRPTIKGGKGYSFIGHHEIMIPLLAFGILEKIREEEK
ncbi:MAG: hypothetical protein QME42_00180 [bacterium]|nr:hypothetical protein [bacterium]